MLPFQNPPSTNSAPIYWLGCPLLVSSYVNPLDGANTSAASKIWHDFGKTMRLDLLIEIDEHCSQVSRCNWLDEMQVEAHFS